MLYREIIAVYFENDTKPINTLCGQNVELLMVKKVEHIVSTGFEGLNAIIITATEEYILRGDLERMRVNGLLRYLHSCLFCFQRNTSSLAPEATQISTNAHYNMRERR
jgi:hypothetical protein